MPNPQNRNDRRKGEDRSETLIIPHITKEMLETARPHGGGRGLPRGDRKGHLGHAKPGQPASSPASRPAQHAAPAPQPMATRRSVNTASSPPAALVFRPKNAPLCASRCRWGRHRQKRPQPEPEQEALRQEAARRAANRPAWFGRRQTAQNDSQEAARRAAQALAAAPRARRPRPLQSGRAYRYPHHCHPKTAYCIPPGGTGPRSHPRDVCGPAAAHSGRTCPAVCRPH